jgi:DNA-binding response OmpR family regulator
MTATPPGHRPAPMEASAPPETLHVGPVEVRPAEHMAFAGGQMLILSVHEFRVLCHLAMRRDRIVTREELYREVWRADLREGDRSVDVYVRKLRVKLADALPEFVCIHTHVGFGYRFTPERSHPFHTRDTVR